MKIIPIRLHIALPGKYGFGEAPVNVVGYLHIPTESTDLPRHMSVMNVFADAEVIYEFEVDGEPIQVSNRPGDANEQYRTFDVKKRQELGEDVLRLYIEQCRKELENVASQRGVLMEDICNDNGCE